MGIGYRPFRNFDPPALVHIWNQALTGRGGTFLPGALPLEAHVLSKPYFDPQGLIVAEEEGKPVGFVHAGFGPDEGHRRLATDPGVICVLAVLPSHRGQGIGKELLRRGEGYLRGKGAKIIYFGAMRPLQPFYLGLYGGSELPGVLISDTPAEPFLTKCHYAVCDQCTIFQRGIEATPTINDPRFLNIRRKYDLRIYPRPITRPWYDECVMAHLEMLQFELRDRSSSEVVGDALTWEMDLFGWRWHQPSVGIHEVEVHEGFRRQGLGKYLLAQVLRYLHDQFFSLVEIQTMQRNAAALGLYESLGFQKVDEGRVYRLEEPA